MINELRGKIDLIDDQLIELLIKRFGLVDEIIKIKKRENIPIKDSVREKEIIDRLSKISGLSREKVTEIYNVLFSCAIEKSK